MTLHADDLAARIETERSLRTWMLIDAGICATSPGIAARIEVDGFTVVYSGDIVAFEDPETALAGADLYIGDGSTLTSSLVRRHPSGVLLGHTTVRAQLGWLARRGVPHAIFSHFGKGPIEMGEEALGKALEELSRVHPPGCRVTAARDGLKMEVGP